ncbi:cytochrome P450 [Gymnopilus junonius]|uniref:Cytochrome P450 n=1 Tax=Gymnopilus junonius TaxID=109634 RepID=A0A9P5TSU5_GYMJU|nr:cytochrome P450 [Gymnopilus junonius]
MLSTIFSEEITLYHTSVFFLVFFTLCSLLRRRRAQQLANSKGLPHPPGPNPLPIVGNLFDLARGNETGIYERLAKEYGELVFLSALGKHVLVVNSFQAATELFDKRSAIYSDRAQAVMSHELMGWDFSFAHMRYGERWKKHRRVFHRQFQQAIAPAYWSIQRREAHALLRRLLHSPENLDYHLRHNAAAVIMSVTYGITIAFTGDHYIRLAEKALEGMAAAARPGAFLVDFVPFLKHIPDWVPGTSFKRKAQEWRAAVTGMKDAPFATVVNDMKDGKATPSFVCNLLNELDVKEGVDDDIETIKNCAGLTYAAGAESTVSTLASFILAIVLYPEVQAKAQDELDRVVGRDRLPDFSDRPSLPYISAIIKEVLRWNPVAPLGFPHMSTQGDELNGYFIPAGTIVIGHSRAILNDPIVFPEPRRFNPDRFMSEQDKCPNSNRHLSPTDPLSASFGYGRRFCPGRYVGEAQVWISVACILSSFNIGPALDEMGLPIEVTPGFTTGMICHPLPFRFSMKPRGESAKVLIQQTEFNS